MDTTETPYFSAIFSLVFLIFYGQFTIHEQAEACRRSCDSHLQVEQYRRTDHPFVCTCCGSIKVVYNRPCSNPGPHLDLLVFGLGKPLIVPFDKREC